MADNATASSKAGDKICYGVIILAAGSSRRMGRPKLLLPWGGTSVVDHLIERWKALRAGQIAVVTTATVPDLEKELDRIRFPGNDRILNPDPDRGMFSSIQCAAAWPGWKKDLTHWVITLGDQPHLRPDTLQALLDLAGANPDRICQPIRSGRRKHPVVLPKPIFAALRDSAAVDLKQFLQEHAHEFAGLESEDAGLDLDMDTPTDYERLKEL